MVIIQGNKEVWCIAFVIETENEIPFIFQKGSNYNYHFISE